MKCFNVNLTDKQFTFLDSKYHNSGKSSDVGKRALEIVKIFFKNKNSEYSFLNDVPLGVDLVVKLKKRMFIEVKGTSQISASKKDVVWYKLGISGKSSHTYLKNGMPLYRVTGVFDKSPIIFVLKYELDYKIKTERRWKIKEIRKGN